MPTVEIVRFPGSDAFVTDNLVFKECLSTLVKSEGCISPYYGIQTEDNRSGYLFVIWESYEHHMKLTKHDSYPGLLTSLRLARSGPSDVQHVDFDKDAAVALESPATEVVVMTLRAGADVEELKKNIIALSGHLAAQKPCHSVVVGESREKKESYFMLIGWDSVQGYWKAHLDAVKKEVFHDVIKNLHELAEIDLKHAKLTKYSE